MKIPQPKYLLREPKNNDKTQINLVVRYDNNKFVYNTGERVHPQYWDFNKQQVKKATSFPEYTDINQWLNKLEDHIISIFRELRINKMEIDNSILKDEMDKRLNISKKKDEVTLFSFIENYIETNKKLKSEGTIKVYQTSYNHLIKFQEQYKTKINFKTIDLTFYDSLMNYFLNELKYSSNTAGKYIKTLKVFLNEATERGLNETIYYKSKKFKRLSMDTDKIYLTETELLDLYNLTNLEKNEELIRDLFILLYLTPINWNKN